MGARTRSGGKKGAKGGGRGAKPASAKKKTKKAPPPRRATDPEGVARKIVRATRNPGKVDLEDLYTADCVSVEAGGQTAHGLEGLRAKLQGWESQTRSSQWTARNTWIKGNKIAIEWDAKLTMADGRTVEFPEVAVHELKGGKIAAERFYYDPARLGLAAGAARPARPGPTSQPRAPVPPPPEPGTPPLDPFDL